MPYNRDGAMIGFKLIGVKGKSLWKKAGLTTATLSPQSTVQVWLNLTKVLLFRSF